MSAQQKLRRRVRWHRASRLIVGAVAVLTVVSAQDSGYVGTTVLMPGTDEFYRNNLPGHRSYVELDAIEFTLSLTNGSQVALAVDERKLQEAYTARVRTDFDVPVSLRWTYDSNNSVRLSADQRVVLTPQEGAQWTLAIHRTDGQPFTWGDYVVSLSAGNLRRAISTSDGGLWGGRVTEGGAYQRIVSVKAPTTTAETARRWGIAATAARERGDNEAALQALRRAADADPSLTDNLAVLYLATGRYKEAAAGYERIVARRGLNQDDLATKFLAQAYVGLGDERKASEVLLKGGVPPGSMAEELTKLRDRVIERRREIQR